MDIQSIQTTFFSLVEKYGWKVLAALIILIAGRILAGIITWSVKKVVSRSKGGKTLAAFAGNLTFIGIMVFAIVAAINKLEIQTTSFVAILGAAGLAIGLALQGSLSNFASGVMLVLFRPFEVGDVVQIGGVTGMVEEIQIFVTTLSTPDKKTIIIPNSKITSDTITNFSTSPVRRVDMVVGIAYNADIDKAKSIVKEILDNDPRVLKDPAYTVVVAELAESSVNLAIRPHVEGADYWDVLFETQEKVKKAFDANGIGIPFPQRDVHIITEKA